MELISDINSIDFSRWSQFIWEHPDGNIFQTPEIFKVYQNTPNYTPIIIVCQDTSGILGVLLAVVQKESGWLMGHFSSRSIIFGGPLVLNNDLTILNYLILEYNKIIQQKAIYSQFRNLCTQNDKIETFANNKFNYEDHLNILLDLSIGETALFNGFSKSRKKGIKKAQHENFTIKISNEKADISDFYDLVKLTYNRIKIPLPPKSHFIELANTLTSDDYKIFLIKKDDITIIALFTLVFKKTIYGYYMGSTNDKEIIKRKPIDLLFWEVFKWAIDNDLQYFDWMGAGKPNKDYGVRDFKLEYGGQLVNYGRFEKIHNPLLYRLSSLTLKIWQKLK